MKKNYMTLSKRLDIVLSIGTLSKVEYDGDLWFCFIPHNIESAPYTEVRQSKVQISKFIDMVIYDFKLEGLI